MKKKTIIIFAVSAVILIGALTVFSVGSRAFKPVKFSHRLHVLDNEMACEDCHTTVMSGSFNARAIPDHEICIQCHETDDETNCATCHKDPNNPEKLPPIQGAYYGFAHNKHTDFKCHTCHGKISEKTSDPVIPVMSDCQTCHKLKKGPLECESCHMGVDNVPVPQEHKLADWKEQHGMDAAGKVSNCSQCHTQESCDECHQGENIYGKPHPEGWLFNHFTEASFGGDCMVCHESREECTTCHRAWQPVPHPLGAAFANSEGGQHTELAESFIEACISCHDVGGDDPTCARCH